MPKFVHKVTLHATFVTEADTAEDAAMDVFDNYGGADIMDAIDNAPGRYGWGDVEHSDEFPTEIR